MKLKELYNVNSEIEIKRIQTNSKQCQNGDLFVCIKGASVDRHDFIDDAIKNGASAVVVTKDVENKSVPVIKVDNIDDEYIRLCKKINNNPQDKLKIIGVTGTDGKTSCATIIQTLLGSDTCGYVGTNGAYSSKVNRDNPNTTPSPELLYSFMHDFYESGCKYLSLEASSEAFVSGRLKTLDFDVSIFTNLTREHLNTHKTMENYLEAKLNLFRQTKKEGISIINKDDNAYEKIKEACTGKVYSYGKDSDNDLYIKDFKLSSDHTNITYVYEGKEINIDSPLLGDFNVYNLGACLLCTLLLGMDLEVIKDRIKNLNVDGRLQMIDTNSDYHVMVDYAHTPNGVKKLLEFVKSLNYNNVITVTGQAGERDREKRPILGKIVADNSNYAIFTSEDPRSENPSDICNDIISDITSDNYEIIIDRREAIKKAIMLAKENDIVLILGKGNENYQKIGNEKVYFNDIEEAKKLIIKRGEPRV